MKMPFFTPWFCLCMLTFCGLLISQSVALGVGSTSEDVGSKIQPKKAETENPIAVPIEINDYRINGRNVPLTLSERAPILPIFYTCQEIRQEVNYSGNVASYQIELEAWDENGPGNCRNCSVSVFAERAMPNPLDLNCIENSNCSVFEQMLKAGYPFVKWSLKLTSDDGEEVELSGFFGIRETPPFEINLALFPGLSLHSWCNSTSPTDPCPVGSYSGSYGFRNSTGIFESYRIEVWEWNCVDDSAGPKLYDERHFPWADLIDVSNSGTLGFNSLTIEGSKGFFVDAPLGSCYRVDITLFNICDTDKKTGYFVLDAIYADTPPSTSLNANQDRDFLESEQLNFLNLFPNPTVDVLNIQSPYEVESLVVLDLLGREVALSQKRTSIDVSLLPKGSYFIRVSLANSTASTLPFIKF